MILMFIVYSNSIDADVVDIVVKYAGGYTKFTDVQGEGRREPQLGTNIWPGINYCMMVAVEKENEKYIVESIEELKKTSSEIYASIFTVQLKKNY